jgi:hypothetical protein
MENNLFLEAEQQENSAFLTEPTGIDSQEEKGGLFPSPFLIGLAHQMKKILGSIETFTQLSRQQFKDGNFGEYFYKTITVDTEKIDYMLDSLLDYIRINTPVKKTNTVHLLLEESLRRHAGHLQEKGVKIIRKFQKDLPETIVPDEQLKYILTSVLNYATPVITSNGRIGFFTRTIDTPKRTGSSNVFLLKEGKFVEILIGFTGHKKLNQNSEIERTIQTLEKEEPMDFILRLVKEVVQKNQGIMNMEVDEKKSKTLISLKFPVERRKVFRFQSMGPSNKE